MAAEMCERPLFIIYIEAKRKRGPEGPRTHTACLPAILLLDHAVGPDNLAAGILDLFFPRLLHQFYHAGRHGHVVKLLGQLAAVAIRPVEELENLLAHLGFFLLPVNQDEGGTGDRPAVLAGLIGQHQVESRGAGPIGTSGRRLERLAVRFHEPAGLVLELGVSHLVLQRVGVLHVTNGALEALDVRSNALITLAAHAGGPGNRGVVADLFLELGAELREVMREDESRTGTVRTSDDRDLLLGELEARVQFDDGRIIPFLDLSKIDVSEHRSAEFQFTRLDAGDIDHRNDAAHDHGELYQADLVEFFDSERRVRGAEVHGPGRDLLDAAARTDGLIVHAHTGLGLVDLGPFGVDGVGEGGTRAVNGCFGLNQARGQSERDHTGDDQMFQRFG